MSTAKLIRFSGLISLLAGVLHIIGALLHPVGEDLAAVNSPNWVPAHLVFWISGILMLFGLVGLYAYQVEKTGWLGLVSFVLSFIGTALVGALLFMVATIVPSIAVEASDLFEQAMTPPTFTLPVIFLGYGLGFILFGVATMRAGVLPRWSGLLLVTGTIFSLVEGSPIDQPLQHAIVTAGRVIFGLGLVWMGYSLWSEKRESARAENVSFQPRTG
ncbi:MAG: hypothetical protein PVG14_02560 [Anaerolineales bacterium]